MYIYFEFRVLLQNVAFNSKIWHAISSTNARTQKQQNGAVRYIKTRDTHL